MTISTGEMNRRLTEIRAKIERASPSDLAYAAGLFDGEGCVAIYQRKNQSTFFIDIANTDRRPLRWLVDTFGGRICRGHGSDRPGRRQCFKWYLMNSQAAIFLAAIRQFTKIKSEQIDLAQEFALTKGTRGVALSPEILALRHSLANQVSALKRAVIS